MFINIRVLRLPSTDWKSPLSTLNNQIFADFWARNLKYFQNKALLLYAVLKGESHFKKRTFFTNANKNLALRPLTEVSANFPYEIRLQRSPKFDIVANILNSIQQPGHIFMTSFCPRDFWQTTNLLVMAALEPYHFKANVLQTPQMIAVKIVNWVIG